MAGPDNPDVPVTSLLFPGDLTLVELTQQSWGNHILYRLALALGYTPENGTIVADPDTVLDEALETIWQYRDLQS